MTEQEKQQLVEAVITQLKNDGTDVSMAKIVEDVEDVAYILCYNSNGEIVRVEPTTINEQEEELLKRIQGTSEKSDSRLDPFKDLGSFSSADEFNAVLDTLTYNRDIVGYGYGFFRATLAYRNIEIKNTLLSSGENVIIQVLSGVVRVVEGVITATGEKHNVLFRKHTATDGWSAWSESNLSDEDKVKLDKAQLVENVSWGEGNNLDNYTTEGVYSISGNRNSSDNMPILNSGEISARLTVLKTQEGNNTVITQVLNLNNLSGGEGNVYIRSNQNGTWKPWGKLQTNVEVGQVKTLDHLTDNGIYSGVFTDGTPTSVGTFYDTFVLIVINNYAVSIPTGNPQAISQLKYSLGLDGSISVASRKRDQYGYWDNWTSLDEKSLVAEEKTRAEQAEQEIESNAMQYDSLGVYVRADKAEIYGRSINTTPRVVEFPAATTESAGVMSAGDKQMLYQSFVKSVGEFQSRNYDGIYCANANTGNVAKANSTSNGIVIQVKEGEVYKIIGDNLKYNASSVQFYNGYPSLDTNISNVYIRNDQVKVPQGAVYMLVSVNPSKGTETTIKQLNWITMEDSALLSAAIENIGSDYKTQIINVTQGVAAGSNTVFPISLLNEGDIIQCYVDSDIDVRMSLVTFNGRVILAIKTNQVFTKEITADDITGNTFGFYINRGQAVESGTLNCALRIIKKDASPITLSRYALKSQEISNEIESLSNTLDEVIEIPNNNNYIKNWEIGNKLVVRLYVENRDKALEDKLYISQIFKLSETNYGFNFGTKNSKSDITIAPNIGPFEVYEITRYFSQGVRGSKYGKIAIRIDWNAIDWGTSTAEGISEQTESNLNDICFDWNEFVKPLQPTINIADGSITESKLNEELKEKLNSSVPLQRYELFSLGDSLSAGGVWQTKVAELTGCIFDQSKNVKAGAMLSVGGTSSFGTTFDNVLWRAKNLIDQGYITDEGENAIVILENVNDGYVAFDENVKSVIPTTPIEGYNDSDFSSSFLESINDKAQLNAVLRLNTVIAGRNLRIDNLPTKAGNITLRIGWSGPGISNYNVFVEPQATNEETLAHVLDKILEYAYTGITDVLGEDGRSVDFSSGNSNYLPTVQFTDTDNTGMTVTITDNPNAKGSVARYFIGENISEWTDTTKWQKGISYSQGWKSAIEMLQRAYPKLHIFVSMFPLHSVTASDYLLPNGSYDTVAYNSVSRMEMMRKMQVELAKIAEFYSVPFINVFAECGIGINNMLTYYNASANVHPKNEGYYRFGETIAAQLKRFLA